MSRADVEKLLSQCKSNDVDAKIEGVSGLQQLFEAGTKLEDTDGISEVLKSCLKHSNQHLYIATLTALPSFFPLLVTGSLDTSNASIDIAALKQVLLAFLPVGGLLDRLGDSRERAREKARESLVILAGLAFRSGSSSFQASGRGRDAGKGPESPMSIWERLAKESGLQSKVWRVREQSLIVLSSVRRLYPMFPLKPYLPSLVELLEDTDGTVRECARQSIVELFTGPTVTDAARADLKKEMMRRGVRKTIVDSVIQKLASGGQTNSNISSPGPSEVSSEGAESPQRKEYIPPSLRLQGRQASNPSTQFNRSLSVSNSVTEVASRPESRLGDQPVTPTGDSAEVASVYVASYRDLESEFAQMLKHFEGKETEHNWAARERSIIRIRGMLKGEAHLRYTETFLAGFKNGMLEASFKTLASLRTTVAVHTCNLYSELAVALGPTIDGFFEPLLSHLLSMASLTKKIVAIQSQQTLDTVIKYLSPQPKLLLNRLWDTLQDKNVSSRQYSIGHVKLFVEEHGASSKHLIEGTAALEYIERAIKKGLADSNPAVRETARSTFWLCHGIWEERATVILDALDAPARKQLEKACPDPSKANAPATPKLKKSSVAAAIAASRAKAKAIATAPPTLRHQATSTSHILQSSSTSPTQRPPSRSGVLQRIPLGSRRSPPSRPISPSSPPARRIASFSPTSSTSMTSAPAPPVHSRTRSNDAATSPTTHRRFASYQLSPPSSNNSDTLETAAKTALPSSPRTSVDYAAGIAIPSSPPRYRERVPSPTRIPSPTRRSGARVSLISFANGDHSLRGRLNGREESMLLAQTIPLPEDSDSEDESPMMSFSAPYEKYQLSLPKTTTSSLSAGSPPPNAPEPIVEDALRARAEQAESAAERLLELVEPDDDPGPIPQALLRSSGSPPRPAKHSGVLQPRTENIPSTPVTKKSSVFKQAAMFKDSPVNKKTISMLDVLHERKHVTGWWVKRISLTDKGSPLTGMSRPAQLVELKRVISALEEGTADVSTLKDLAHICSDNVVQENGLLDTMNLSQSSYPDSPTPIVKKLGEGKTVWEEEKIFNRMFNALLSYLSADREVEKLEYGLIALWEIIENQAVLAEGRENDLFTSLLRLRFCSKINVLEATNTIRDALASRIEPVYGLTTLHASLRAFNTEPLSGGMTKEVKLASYAFGLIALGKFILRLPAEILEDELPRLKSTLTSALSEPSSLVVRESAAMCIIAAQLVLRDETHLFTLLDGLPDEKKNLLTYLFDKHGARGTQQAPGTEKLEKEMRRLDGRTSTPPRAFS